MAAHMKARVVKVKTRPDFSKQLISDIRWLLWAVTIGGLLLAGYCIRQGYTGSLPWSGIPGTLWIRADKMQLHPLTTVVKVELEGEITYNLGHGEVVTNND